MSTVETMQRITRRYIYREAKKQGSTKGEALQAIARSTRISPGTLANIARARLKSINADVRDKIIAALIADLSQEIQRLEHERQTYLALGIPPNCRDMDEAETALEAAKLAIERMRAGR